MISVDEIQSVSEAVDNDQQACFTSADWGGRAFRGWVDHPSPWAVAAVTGGPKSLPLFGLAHESTKRGLAQLPAVERERVLSLARTHEVREFRRFLMLSHEEREETCFIPAYNWWTAWCAVRSDVLRITLEQAQQYSREQPVFLSGKALRMLHMKQIHAMRRAGTLKIAHMQAANDVEWALELRGGACQDELDPRVEEEKGWMWMAALNRVNDRLSKIQAREAKAYQSRRRRHEDD